VKGPVVILRHLYHNDLAQASYLVGCAATGEALIVDPNRDIQQYIDLAEREGLKITKVTETHIHADYVSGARELAARTGAELFLSREGTEDWQYGFARESGATLIGEGDVITLGNIRIDVMHTPGHTPEHISFLVTDQAGADKPMGVFTGDFVFVGDVGRPDLLEKAAGYANTMEDGGRQLYHSLERIKSMEDYIQIWPGHGAGSPCGKALGAVPQSTIGYERLFNPAFQFDREDDFVDFVLADQPEPPVYFAQMKHVNKVGPAITSELNDPIMKAMDDLETALLAEQPIADLRPAETYAEGHIPGTINIALGKGFVTWAGWLLPYDRPFHVIVDSHQIDWVTKELRMIGLDDLASYFDPAVVDQWQAAGKELGNIPQVTVDQLDAIGDHQIVDVRGATEYVDGHIPGSTNIPVGYVGDNMDKIADDKPAVFQCQSGRRSSIAASVAAAKGRENVYNLVGGFGEYEKSGKPVEKERQKATAAS
jgi:hydroxyacylglutathione hydrolase